MNDKFFEYEKAAKLLKSSKCAIAFTGAGISVESGIPPFRGKNGIWTKYNPEFLELDYFLANPRTSWRLIKELFYSVILEAKPNKAHIILSTFEKEKIIKWIITQNIDNLHYKAGSKNILEFHGNTRYLICLKCRGKYPVEKFLLEEDYPICKVCGGLLKPDFVFFSENIDSNIYTKSVEVCQKADVMLVIGTSGIVQPAASLPLLVKQNNGKIIEINKSTSEYTHTITDIFLEGSATKCLETLYKIFHQI